jgi:hypothetical protein
MHMLHFFEDEHKSNTAMCVYWHTMVLSVIKKNMLLLLCVRIYVYICRLCAYIHTCVNLKMSAPVYITHTYLNMNTCTYIKFYAFAHKDVKL